MNEAELAAKLIVIIAGLQIIVPLLLIGIMVLVSGRHHGKETGS